MAIRLGLPDCIAEYAAGVNGRTFGDIATDYVGGRWITGQEILEECARQAQVLDPSSESDRAKEKRLRQLSSIVLSMKEVGLIE